MDPATAYLMGNLIGAGLITLVLALARKWRWVPVPIIGLFIICAISYRLATS